MVRNRFDGKAMAYPAGENENAAPAYILARNTDGSCADGTANADR